MKLRIIFLKKKHIFLMIPLIVLILLIVFLIYKKYFYITSPTFASISKDQVLKADFNGDGITDSMYVKQYGSKYVIKIKIKNKIFDLLTEDQSYMISNYLPYWPMKVTILDVSRNRIPEIFIQGSLGKNSLQRIFVFNGKKFEDVSSNSNNILGFIDCTNNRTPKVITGRFHENSMVLTNYIFLNYKLKNYDLEDPIGFMGKDTISAFINFIHGIPFSKPYMPDNIFSDNISHEDLNLIEQLSKENNSYIFEDAIFMEKKCDKNGNTSRILWTLNFKETSNSDTSKVKNHTINLILSAEKNNKEPNYFKIVSIY